jgi:hypothetical protein
MRDLFSNVISVPLPAGDCAPAFDYAPAGVCPALGTSEMKTVSQGFFFIGRRKNIVAPRENDPPNDQCGALAWPRPNLLTSGLGGPMAVVSPKIPE